MPMSHGARQSRKTVQCILGVCYHNPPMKECRAQQRFRSHVELTLICPIWLPPHKFAWSLSQRMRLNLLFGLLGGCTLFCLISLINFISSEYSPQIIKVPFTHYISIVLLQPTIGESTLGCYKNLRQRRYGEMRIIL